MKIRPVTFTARTIIRKKAIHFITPASRIFSSFSSYTFLQIRNATMILIVRGPKVPGPIIKNGISRYGRIILELGVANSTGLIP